MSDRFSTTDTTHSRYPAVRLATPDGALAATFAPTVGMVGCSLLHRGDELLGERGGLGRYAEKGSTMGIPLLHPWANRLAGFGYSFAGRSVTLDERSPLIHIDSATGLPIHGVLAGSPYWRDVERGADASAATLTARLDFDAHPDLLAPFPFPHELRLTVRLERSTLTIATELRPTGDTAVPVSFGFHPYLRLPTAPRAEWHVELPVRRRLVLDERMIPTGETEPVEIAPGPLGARTFDDGFTDLAPGAPFVLSGGGRRIEVRFDAGYRFAQVYAPADQDVVCFEPMTAPTNALAAGGPQLRLAQPGELFSATFSIAIHAA